MSGASTAIVIEHLVFFNMEGLSNNPVNETSILQGLNDLVYSNHGDLYFLYAGCLLQSKGVQFTHALISRFSSVEALRVYYDSAIKKIATEMRPWLKKEYCVDYVVEMEKNAMLLDITKEFVSHVTFIKLGSNVSDSDIKGAMNAFLALAHEVDYAVQLTTGENLYVRESHQTMSHAFSAYFTSVDELEKWQADPAVVSVLQGTILPMADSYAMVAVVPYVKASANVGRDVQ